MNKLDNIGYYDKRTGDELTEEVVRGVQAEEARKKYTEMYYKLETHPEELTSKEIEDLVKHSSKLKMRNIKEYDLFQEYYTGNKKKLIEAIDNLSDPAYKCFSALVLKYTSTENTLQYKNHVNIVKDKDISRILNISISKWYNIKKELIEFSAIRKVNFDGKTVIKINPTIIGHSMKITKCTYYAFRDQLTQEFGMLKSLYWDKLLVEEFGLKVFE